VAGAALRCRQRLVGHLAGGGEHLLRLAGLDRDLHPVQRHVRRAEGEPAGEDPARVTGCQPFGGGDPVGGLLGTTRDGHGIRPDKLQRPMHTGGVRPGRDRGSVSAR